MEKFVVQNLILKRKRPAPNQILTIQFALETDRYRVIIILRPILLLLWT